MLTAPVPPIATPALAVINPVDVSVPDADSSGESADVKAMVAQFHTDTVKAAYAKHLEDNKPSEE